MREGVIEKELAVVYELGDPVHLVLALMHGNHWVRCTNAVYLSILQLIRENGSLFDTHTDFKLVSGDVL